MHCVFHEVFHTLNFCFISDKKQDNRTEDTPDVSKKSVEEARVNQEFTVQNDR
jgi:hypothetical protein